MAERDAERGTFPVSCTGTLQDREDLAVVARLGGKPIGYIVRRSINLGLRQVLAEELPPDKLQEVQFLVNRILATVPQDRRPGRHKE